MLHHFHCHDCNTDKVHDSGPIGGGVGYCETDSGTVCYACMAKRDKVKLDAAQTFTLYFVRHGEGWKVQNWCGTLSFPAYGITSERQPGRVRKYTFYFRDHKGREWKGRNAGDNQIARCHLRQRHYQSA